MEKKKDLLYEKFKDRCSDNGITGEESGDIEMCWIIARDILTQERQQELGRAREEGIREAVEEAYEYGRDSIRLPMSLTKEQVIDKLLNK